MLRLPEALHLLALLTTLAVECSVAALCFATYPATRPRVVRLTLLVAGINLVTHTVFWYTLWLVPGNGLLRLCTYEAAVVVLEGALIAWFGRIRLMPALLISLLANAASYYVGIVVTFAR